MPGDYAKLERLTERFRALASGAVTRDLRDGLAKSAMGLIAAGFRDARDPYGRAWAPLKRRRGRTLDLSGAMKRGFRVRVTSTGGFRITNGRRYAGVHQHGAPRAHIPRRQMVPVVSRGGLPRAWRAAFRAVASRVLRARFRAT